MLALPKESTYENVISIRINQDREEFGFKKGDYLFMAQKPTYLNSELVYTKPEGIIQKYEDANSTNLNIVGKIVAMYRRM